ncbi:glycosyl hydrolase [Haloarcula sp. NS06]|uniref:glycosyl hydrolase n=1 Tax=Haloarcula sp. NS06 TaxID=3409688 RepID=UPI003DA79D1C
MTVLGSGLLSGCRSLASDPSETPAEEKSVGDNIGVGIYLGDESALKPWEEWFGRTVDHYSFSVPRDGWDDYRIKNMPFEIPIEPIADQRDIIVTAKMFPPSDSTLSAVAGGEHTEQHRNFGSSLTHNGMADATIRIGHEFNGHWSSDGAVGRPDMFIEAWKQTVSAMNSVGGSNFSYIWAPSNGREDMDPTTAYPGDEWVDMIGPTVYDAGEIYQSQCGNRSIKYCREQNWKKTVNEEFGLDFWAEFSRRHEKTLVFPEYGITARNWNGAGGGDNRKFIANIAEWMSANSDIVGWHNLWSYTAGPHYIGPDSLHVSDQYSSNPDASEEFRSQFR